MPEQLSAAVTELAVHLDELTGHLDGVRDEIRAERDDRREQTARIVRWTRLVVVMVVLVGIASVGGAYLLIQRNAQDISRNSRRLEQVVYAQCVTRNQGVARQNALLDAAIATERRKAHPNAAQLKALQDFKGNLADCGAKP